MTGIETSVRSLVAVNRQPLAEPAMKSVEQSASPLFSPKPKQSWKPEPVEQQKELIAEKPQLEVKVPEFTKMGVLHGRYILMQGEEGLVILDPKSCSANVSFYEEVMGKQGDVPSQGILIPEVVELDAHDFDIVKRNADHFADAGIQMDEFGGHSFQVSGLPEFVKVDSPREFVTELIDELIATQETKKGKSVAYDLFARQIARKAGYF